MRGEEGVARNVVLFVGDGMGMSTVTAARFYMAQRRGLNIHDTVLSWEGFPYTGLARVSFYFILFYFILFFLLPLFLILYYDLVI